MSKGFKSTEFWMTVLGVAVATYLANAGASIEVILAVAGMPMAYAASRGIAKHGVNA